LRISGHPSVYRFQSGALAVVLAHFRVKNAKARGEFRNEKGGLVLQLLVPMHPALANEQLGPAEGSCRNAYRELPL
jgi:hypothetical protein